VFHKTPVPEPIILDILSLTLCCFRTKRSAGTTGICRTYRRHWLFGSNGTNRSSWTSGTTRRPWTTRLFIITTGTSWTPRSSRRCWT